MLRGSLIFVFLIAFATAASAADWHYFGESAGKPTESLFYDADSVQRLPPEIVRVWTKELSEKALLLYSATESGKRTLKKLTDKAKAGYIPGYLLLPAIKNEFPRHGKHWGEAVVSLTMDELLADNDDVQPDSILYWQIDCRNRRMGLLSFTVYSPKGAIRATHDFSVPTYQYIAPDSTGQWLSEMVCLKH